MAGLRRKREVADPAEALVRKAGEPENLVITPLQEPGQPE